MSNEKKVPEFGVTAKYRCDIDTEIFKTINEDLREYMDEAAYVRYRSIDIVTSRGKEAVARVAARVLSQPEIYGMYPNLRLTVTATIDPLDGEGNVI